MIGCWVEATTLDSLVFLKSWIKNEEAEIILSAAALVRGRLAAARGFCRRPCSVVRGAAKRPRRRSVHDLESVDRERQLRPDRFEDIAKMPDDWEISQNGVLALKKVVDDDRPPRERR